MNPGTIEYLAKAHLQDLERDSLRYEPRSPSPRSGPNFPDADGNPWSRVWTRTLGSVAHAAGILTLIALITIALAVGTASAVLAGPGGHRPTGAAHAGIANGPHPNVSCRLLAAGPAPHGA